MISTMKKGENDLQDLTRGKQRIQDFKRLHKTWRNFMRLQGTSRLQKCLKDFIRFQNTSQYFMRLQVTWWDFQDFMRLQAASWDFTAEVSAISSLLLPLQKNWFLVWSNTVAAESLAPLFCFESYIITIKY